MPLPGSPRAGDNAHLPGRWTDDSQVASRLVPLLRQDGSAFRTHFLQTGVATSHGRTSCSSGYTPAAAISKPRFDERPANADERQGFAPGRMGRLHGSAAWVGCMGRLHGSAARVGCTGRLHEPAA